jgi:hypothetical protein
MPTHTVHLRLPKSTIVNSDAEVFVYSDGALLGTVAMSKGGIDWWPANTQKRHYKLTWEKFAGLMVRDAREVR